MAGVPRGGGVDVRFYLWPDLSALASWDGPVLFFVWAAYVPNGAGQGQSNKRRSAPLAAAEAGCDPIDVSLPGLLQYVPQLLCEGHHPLDWMLTYGKPLGFLRPHARLQVVAHTIATAQVALPPAEFVSVGYARVLLPRPISTTNLYWFLVR